MSNISFADFHLEFLYLLGEHAPVKKRYIRASQKNFIGKELNQAITGSRGKNSKFLTLLILAVDIFKYSISLYFYSLLRIFYTLFICFAFDGCLKSICFRMFSTFGCLMFSNIRLLL